MRACLQNNIPEIAERVERVAWAVRTKYKQKATDALEATRGDLLRNTPKATGKMASGWRLKVIGGSPKGRTPIAGWVFNYWAEGGSRRYASRSFTAYARDFRTGQLMKGGSRRGEGPVAPRKMRIKTEGEKILRILEFGSQPHTIRAAHITAKGLPGSLRIPVWTTGSARAGSQVQDFIFRRKVQHPGTPAYKMIAKARLALRKRIRLVNRQVALVPDRVMRGRE